MEDTHLDEFAAEDEPVAAPPRRPEAAAPEPDAPVRIVLTDEQLASSWEMLPSERPEAPPSDETFDAPFLQEAEDDYRFAEPSIIDTPTENVAEQVDGERRSLVPAVIVVALAMGLVGGRAIVKQFGTAPTAAVTPSPSQPATTPSSATTPPPTVDRSADPPANLTAAAPVDPAPATVETSPAAIDADSRAATTAPQTPIVPTNRSARAEVTARNTPPARAIAERRAETPSRVPTPSRVASPTRVEQSARVETPPRAVGAANVAARPTPASPSPAAPPPVTKTTSTPPPAANVAAATPPRATEPPAVATRAPQPAAEAVAAAAAPPVVSPPTPPPPAAPVLAPETRAVLIALYKYQEAFSNLDSGAAHDIWPSVDVKALDRAFGQLDQQTVDLKGCNVGVNGNRAEAACTGTASYVQKVGKKAMRSEQREWHFTLQQSEGQWLIDRVDARATQ